MNIFNSVNVLQAPEVQAHEIHEGEYFWAKVELPNRKAGYMQSKLIVSKGDELRIVCKRPGKKSLFGLFSSKPIPKGAVIALAFQDKGVFELWSGEVSEYLGNSNDLDEYKLIGIRLEMVKCERRNPRYLVNTSINVSTLSGSLYCWQFSGCEISEDGLGLWFPRESKDLVKVGNRYNVRFKVKGEEPFSAIVECIRPHAHDEFSGGLVAGFIFIEMFDKLYDNNYFAAIKIKQMIADHGQVREQNAEAAGHYLCKFWIRGGRPEG